MQLKSNKHHELKNLGDLEETAKISCSVEPLSSVNLDKSFKPSKFQFSYLESGTNDCPVYLAKWLQPTWAAFSPPPSHKALILLEA